MNQREAPRLEKTPFIQEIKTDLNVHKKGRFMVICGVPGEGKSYTALRIAELIDPQFTVDQVVIMKGSDFMRLMKNGVPTGNGGYKKLHPGSVAVYDECGVGLSSRDWLSVQNRLIGFLMQTIRKWGFYIIFTLPSLSMLDISARRLMSYYAYSQGVDYRAKLSHFKIYRITRNDWEDKTYRRRLKTEEGELIDDWAFSLPQRVDLKEYEARKDTAMNELYAKGYEMFEKIENDGHLNKQIGRPPQKEEVIKNCYNEDIKDINKIAAIAGCTPKWAREVVKTL